MKKAKDQLVANLGVLEEGQLGAEEDHGSADGEEGRLAPDRC